MRRTDLLTDHRRLSKRVQIANFHEPFGPPAHAQCRIRRKRHLAANVNSIRHPFAQNLHSTVNLSDHLPMIPNGLFGTVMFGSTRYFGIRCSGSIFVKSARKEAAFTASGYTGSENAAPYPTASAKAAESSGTIRASSPIVRKKYQPFFAVTAAARTR